MAATSTLSVLLTNSIPKISYQNSEAPQKRDFASGNSHSISLNVGVNSGMKRSWTKLRAGLSQVEPDLNEDPKDRWATNGISAVIKFSMTLCMGNKMIIIHTSRAMKKDHFGDQLLKIMQPLILLQDFKVLFHGYFFLQLLLGCTLMLRESTYTSVPPFLQWYFALLRWISLVNHTTLNLKYITWREELATS